MKSITSVLIILYVSVFQLVTAQEVNVRLSYDTVYAGNVLAIQYSMDNWQGDLKEVDFGDFEVVGGPQVSSSMSYSGGQRQSSKTITFFLKPPEKPGQYRLPSQKFLGDGKEVLTDEKRIIVQSNPDGIQQNPVINDAGLNKFSKEYRRREPERGQRQRF